MRKLEVLSTVDMISSVVAEVEKAKAADLFAPVIVVAKSYHVADRAISAALASSGKAFVNVRAMSITDLFRELCIGTDTDWKPEVTARNMPAAIRSTLKSMAGDWEKVDPEHDSNVSALSRLLKSFEWIDIAGLEINQQIADLPGLTSITSRTIEFVRKVQLELERMSSGQQGILLTKIKAHSTEKAVRFVESFSPTLISIGDQIPSRLLHLIDELGGSVTQISVKPENSEIAAPLYSSPDPDTECSMALDFVGEAIRNGIRPTAIAIAYPDSAEYLPILERALEGANLGWFGRTSDKSMATKPAEAFLTMLQVSERYAMGQSVNRELLLKVFSLGNVPVDVRKKDGTGRELPLEQGMAKHIVENSFFGDSSAWRESLVARQEVYESLLEERDVAVLSGDDETIAEVERQIRRLESAIGLAQILKKFDSLFGNSANLDNSEIVRICVDAIGKIFWDRSWRTELGGSGRDKRTTEAYAAVKKFEKVFGSNGAQNYDVIRSQFTSEMEAQSIRCGSYRSGVVIAPISEIAYSDWSAVAILGCDEASIGNVGKENPLLADSLVSLVSDATDGLIETSASKKAKSIRELSILATVSGNTHFSYSRGGNLRNRDANSLSLFGPGTGRPPKQLFVESIWSYLDEVSTPYRNELHLMKKSAERATESDFTQSPPFRSALAFRRPEGSRFFGGLEELRLLDFAKHFNERVLSASYVERYLECPQHFFVTKVLGISDDEAELEIDEIKATDFGIAIHNAFQHLVDPDSDSFPAGLFECSHQDLKSLIPVDGTAFGLEARAHLLELFRYECSSLTSRNLSGWAPRFREKLRIFERNLDQFLLIDHAARNFDIEWNVKIGPGGTYKSNKQTLQLKELESEFKLAPRLAEVEFGIDGIPTLDIDVENGDEPPVTLRFRGRIDRVDSNVEGTSVTAIDYKSGKASVLLEKSGKKIQDLVYPLAVLKMAGFENAQQVNSLYLALNDSLDDSGVVRLGSRGEVGSNEKSAAEMTEILTALLEGFALSYRTGNFPPRQEKENERGTFCATCLKLGVRTAFRSSVHSQTMNDFSDTANESDFDGH